jgi:hypothetical protein
LLNSEEDLEFVKCELGYNVGHITGLSVTGSGFVVVTGKRKQCYAINV